MEKRVDEIKEFVRRRINEKRFTHSVNTANEAVSLARKYGADVDKAYIAGLLHDVAKGLSPVMLKIIAEKYCLEVDEYEQNNPELMHGKVGAAIVASELGITDEEILSAIKWHTTGHKNMTLLEKIIYIADIIEPGRNYTQTEALRHLAYEDINEAMKTGLMHVMGYVKSQGFSLHPNSIEAYEHLINTEVND